MTLKKEKIKSSLQDLGMPHKVAKQHVVISWFWRMILTRSTKLAWHKHTHEDKIGITQTHAQLVATNCLQPACLSVRAKQGRAKERRTWLKREVGV
jgi:hypothetical protein